MFFLRTISMYYPRIQFQITSNVCFKLFFRAPLLCKYWRSEGSGRMEGAGGLLEINVIFSLWSYAPHMFSVVIQCYSVHRRYSYASLGYLGTEFLRRWVLIRKYFNEALIVSLKNPVCTLLQPINCKNSMQDNPVSGFQVLWPAQLIYTLLSRV